MRVSSLCHELNDTTSLLDLLLCFFGYVSGADDDGYFGETALSEDLGVAEREEVKHRCLVGLLGEVCVALLSGDKRPELYSRLVWPFRSPVKTFNPSSSCP